MLSSKIILVFVCWIRGEEDISTNVSKQNWLIGVDNFSLVLEPQSRIGVVNDPNTLISLVSCNSNKLLMADGRSDCISLVVTGKGQWLSEQVIIRAQFQLLPVPDELVRAEDVYLVDTLKLEDRASHGTRVLALTGASDSISLRHIRYLVTNIDNKVALSGSILYHNLVVPSQAAVIRVSPWDLSIRVLVLRKSLGEWKRI